MTIFSHSFQVQDTNPLRTFKFMLQSKRQVPDAQRTRNMFVVHEQGQAGGPAVPTRSPGVSAQRPPQPSRGISQVGAGISRAHRGVREQGRHPGGGTGMPPGARTRPGHPLLGRRESLQCLFTGAELEAYFQKKRKLWMVGSGVRSPHVPARQTLLSGGLRGAAQPEHPWLAPLPGHLCAQVSSSRGRIHALHGCRRVQIKGKCRPKDWMALTTTI